jgi:glucosamine kinase
MLFAGIDGGQSATIAAISDESAIELARGEAGPADEVGEGPGSTRLRDALEGALAAALARAGLPPEAPFESVVVGISGYEGRIYGASPRFRARRIALMHDAPVAHAGALGGEPGVTVIAGTGSVAYASAADGRTRLEGGWGYVFGDEGSAFWIAREAFAAASAHCDCDGVRSLCAFFERSSLRDIARAFYAGEITRARFAAFAAPCIGRAQSGGCDCITSAVEAAALELAALASRAAFVPDGTVAFAGGLLRDPWFAVLVEACARERMPKAAVVRARRDPAAGALLLALRA